MKRFFPPLAVLAALLALSIWSGRYMTAQALRWQEQLRQADSLAQLNDWNGALHALTDSYADWTAQQNRLHIVTRHDAVAEAETLYRRCMAYAAMQELSDFRAEAAALLDRLRLLSEMEQFSLGNVLTAPVSPSAACSAPP